MKARLARSRPNSLLDYWKLGQAATQVLQPNRGVSGAVRTAAGLAKAIGLESATLRLVLKFASKASEHQVVGLQRAGVPWRGVAYWLGLADPDEFERLYREMLAGLVNSTEIRQYIAQHCGKQAVARMGLDLGRTAQRRSSSTERFTARTERFGKELDRRMSDGQLHATAATRSALGKFAASLARAADVAQAVASKLAAAPIKPPAARTAAPAVQRRK